MEPPVIGAALRLGELPAFRDWLIGRQRDVEVQDFVNPAALLGDWQGLADEVRRALDGHEGRRGIHGPYVGLALDNADPEIAPLVAARYVTGVQACRAIGGTRMVVHSPYSTWDDANLDGLAGARKAAIERVHGVLAPAVRRAEAEGVTLVIENIEDRSPADRRTLAESFVSDAVAVSLDTGHAHYAHVATGAPPVDYYVRSAGARLAHVHLQDSDGFADRHWQIGQGTIRWQAVFRALSELPQRPHLILELRDKADIAGSMAFLEAQGLGT